MKFKCLYITGSTNFETGKSELPQNCKAKGCRGEFDRMKDLLQCYTGPSGIEIGIKRWRNTRRLASRHRALPVALYIDSDPNFIKMAMRMLKGICQIPDCATEVSGIKDAKKIVQSQKPDIVIIDWYDKNDSDRVALLVFIKNLDPKIKVILYSDLCKNGEFEKTNARFDIVIRKMAGEHQKLVDAVSAISKEIIEPDIIRTQRKKLLIIEDNEELLRTVSLLMGEICDLPQTIPVTESLAQAKALIEQHSPDIIISDKLFDQSNKNAHHELLDFIKERNPDTLVILWSCNPRTEDESSAKHSYDSVFFKADYANLILEVKKLNE